MDRIELLRKAIRAEIKNYLNEMSTTGNVAGYLTPNAFSGGKDKTAMIKKMAKIIGYRITDRGQKDASQKNDRLYENIDQVEQKYIEFKTEFDSLISENYYQYRNDPSRKPHQKIGAAISEVNRQLKLVERILKMNRRLQTEYGVTNESLWKRTTHQMVKLEARMMDLASKLREMRG